MNRLLNAQKVYSTGNPDFPLAYEIHLKKGEACFSLPVNWPDDVRMAGIYFSGNREIVTVEAKDENAWAGFRILCSLKYQEPDPVPHEFHSLAATTIDLAGLGTLAVAICLSLVLVGLVMWFLPLGW
jgi:hypothetical protein